MTLKNALFLAGLQGVTEFLPISSSGHLVLAQHFLGLSNVPVLFDIILHLGTVTAIIIVYYKEIGDILKDLYIWIFHDKVKKSSLKHGNVKLAMYLILSTAITGLFGFIFKNRIIDAFYIPSIVPVFFIVTGITLLITRFIHEGNKSLSEINIIYPAVIGAVQAFAMLPGISRSGSTISAGLFMGAMRDFSGMYSFLLSIPSVIGASIFEFADSQNVMLSTINITTIVTAFIISLITGYIALRLLLQFLRKGRLFAFSFYCFSAAILGFFID